MERGANSESLFTSGVLTAQDDDVSLTPTFESAIDDYLAAFEDYTRDELSRTIADRLDEERLVEAFVELGEIDPRSIAELCALHDELAASTDGWISLLPVLRLFRPDRVPAHGAPEPSVPVPADHLASLARIHSYVLAYVWLDDCPPCDSLRARLESLFDQPQRVLLVSVYGPDHKEYLAEEYQVTAGPALLFMRDGTVDARLNGDHGESVVQNELERLQE